MKLKKLFVALFGALSINAALSTSAFAQGLVLCDFENYNIGDTYPMWNLFGGTPVSKAVVEADPKNAKNKVLHVYLKEWNSYPSFTLPSDLAGKALVEQKDYVTLRFMRSNSDANDYKKFTICQGSVRLFEDDGYPHQGDKGVWQNRTYALPQTSEATGTMLALGIHSDDSDYYLDDIVLKGEYDDYKTANDDVINISKQNSSSTYETYSTPLIIPADKSITFLTARYTYFNSNVVGEGTLNIKSGGERTYIGNSDKNYPNGTGFTGVTHVYPYKDLSSSNGFYGLVWMHGGKTFSLDAALTNLDDSKAMNFFQNSTLVLHKGTTLGAESGTHGMRIGHLEMEEGSQLYGYIKSKDANNTYYIVGGNNDDALLAGQMSPMSDNSKMLLGLIKEGQGTYRITGKANNLTGGLRVLNGKVFVNGTTSANSLYIMKEGISGGTGTLKGESQIYGILQPGDEGIGKFTQSGKMTLRPSARIDCEIKDASNYDQVKVTGSATYYNIGQDFAKSEKNPRLRIYLAEDADVKEGDTFTLFTATKKELYDNIDWKFDIRYPKSYTWEVEQTSDATGFKVVATVVSLKYSGQGNVDYDDEDDNQDVSSDDGTFDLADEKVDTTPLRKFADDNNMYIGTCVPVWTINVDNAGDARTNLIAKQFNMVVCENEMKFDAIEPNQNQFEYYHGDRLVKFAQKNNMYVRGHTLAWHQQVPGWLTEDGKKNTYNRSRKELLAILKNHIKNVVTHYKGKVKEWDVANEVLDDNQTTIYSNPNGYDLRPSVWATGIGEDFLDSAFVWTHQYDPDAKLILNDYGVEGKGWGKSEALFNLAKRLRNSGIPIDGVGLQGHMDADLNYIGSIEQNIARYQQEGFLCHITELDLGIASNTNADLEMQANAYYRLARIAMKYSNCSSLMIWGLTDDLTWRNGRRPLLFDANNNKKPAYWGVHAALRQAAGMETTDVSSPNFSKGEGRLPESPEDLDEVYDLMGRRVAKLERNHIYIYKGKKIMY